MAITSSTSTSKFNLKVKMGLLRSAQIEDAFEVLIVGFVLLLLLLSVLGTFYALLGVAVPLLQPWQLLGDVVREWQRLLSAIAIQVVLSLTQWGSRTMVRRARWWWWVYLFALSASIWLNWTAYGPVLRDLGMPLLVAWGLVIGGDIVPELALVEQEDRRG